MVAAHDVPPCPRPRGRANTHEEDARRSWFKAYAAEREGRALEYAKRRPRSFGASGDFGHAEVSESGWHWQSWRGWTTASRYNHEQRMAEQWVRETTDRWREQQKPFKTSWRLDAHDL
eukprot:CAMPEP_0198511418 /NCGR_PEP_ID=MMETSP1462-20131121/14797_1 /TAXON_ID=1333877 /ORGANISM="Brandtodinium nutriculum, Strain RCC3387" /LENGTH=117 /DNA_ID=CAMNT_0044240787 /DNA_START=12 /DNA_END=362 /DNA_ORIENTATION=+